MDGIQCAPDDVVIQVCQHLSVRDILAFRQTCKHVFAVSCLKTLWVSLCTSHITAQGIPFPNKHWIDQMSAQELEVTTREALDRDRRLHYGSQRDGYTPKAEADWDANPGSAISEILFVPDPIGHEGRCIVTVSKGIWCLINLWDIQALGQDYQGVKPIPRKIGSWGPKGAIFNAIAVNSDCHSDASAAIAVHLHGEHRVYIFSFFDDVANGYTPRVHVVRSWSPTLSVCTSVSLCGDTLVVAGPRDRAIVVDIHSPVARSVVLESTTVSGYPQTSNICLDIQISQRYILVARAMFVEVFNLPTDILAADLTHSYSVWQEPIIQHPVDSFTFGWLDGISISQDFSKSDSFFVLFHHPNDDLWSNHAPKLTLCRLEANPTASAEEELPPPSDVDDPVSHFFSVEFLTSVPRSAPASPTSTSSSTSTKLVLGHQRTALWLSPRPRESDSTGLVQMDLNRQEDWPAQARGTRSWRQFLGDDLIWASFGPRETQTKIQDSGDENWTSRTDEEEPKIYAFTRRICNSRGEVWTAIGYDEETGRVALGKGDGSIVFLRL